MMKAHLARMGNKSVDIFEIPFVGSEASEDVFRIFRNDFMHQHNFVIAIFPNNEYIKLYKLGEAENFDCYTIDLYPGGNQASPIFDSLPVNHILLDITIFNAPPAPMISSDPMYKRLVQQFPF